MSWGSVGTAKNGYWHRMSSLEEDCRARQVITELFSKMGSPSGSREPAVMGATPPALRWNQPWRRETWLDTPPQTLGSWEADFLSSWLLSKGLGAFLLEALLLSNQQTRLLFQGGKFFMRHSNQESRHRARGAEKGGHTR